LQLEQTLQSAAEAHARDMAARHRMTHKGSNGSSSASRLSALGYRMRQCGENVAYGQVTCEEVITSWMRSRGHRANILGSYSQIGAACAIALDGTSFWCVTFGLPAARNSPQTAGSSGMFEGSVGGTRMSRNTAAAGS
jgi:uncharacterized protein YkwD